jgi:hypothetical protein
MRNMGLLVLLCILILLTINNTPIGHNVVEANGQVNRPLPGNLNPQYNNEFKVGEKIAEALTGGSWFFMGYITDIGNPRKGHRISYTKVSINVEEQYWGKARELTEVHIDHVTKPLAPRSSGPWEAWEDVDLQIGKRLMVGLWEDTPKRPVYSGKPSDASLVVSEEALFPIIKDVLTYHSRYKSNAQDILLIPLLLDYNRNFAEAGYISRWLWRRYAPENGDNEVQVLLKLFSSENLPELGRAIVMLALRSRLYRATYQLSDTTNFQAIETIVNCSGSDNISIAKNAFRILIWFTQNNQLDIRPFLNEPLRNKIIRNYQKIHSGEDYIFTLNPK